MVILNDAAFGAIDTGRRRSERILAAICEIRLKVNTREGEDSSDAQQLVSLSLLKLDKSYA